MARRWIPWTAAASLIALAAASIAVAAGRDPNDGPAISRDGTREVPRTSAGTQPADPQSASAATVATPAAAPQPERLGEWIDLDTSLGWQGGVEPDLAGKVVLYEFWTFGCSNCQATLPYLRDLYDAYRAHGLEMVGIHYPEFDYEKDRAAIAQASEDLGVTWPVLYDDDRVNWGAAENRWWPRVFIVDQQNQIRFDHIGEGAYTDYEDVIRALLEVPDSVPYVIGADTG